MFKEESFDAGFENGEGGRVFDVQQEKDPEGPDM